jgi:GNAT superfamily N-acetyltransferase
VFAEMDRRSDEQAARLIGHLSCMEQRRLEGLVGEVQHLLSRREAKPPPPGAVVLRDPRPGDLGWVVERHGARYAAEYGWDLSFEALVARIVADFAERPDPARERAWIAEWGGRPVGCIFLVRESDAVARLRLLLVEPDARGHGLGRRLVDAGLAFAAQAGYRRVTLWTNSVLQAARKIYEAAGFRLAREEPHHSFGHDLVGQYWEKELPEAGPQARSLR